MPAALATGIVSTQTKWDTIRKFVEKERKRLNIATFRSGNSFEVSCFGHGGCSNLLYRQLLYMHEDYWLTLGQLEDPDILDGVYREALSALHPTPPRY